MMDRTVKVNLGAQGDKVKASVGWTVYRKINTVFIYLFGKLNFHS